MPDRAFQPDEAAVNQDEFQLALQAVHSLPEIDRTVILMRAEQGLSYEDIAAATGLTVIAVRVRIFRARAKLATLLNPKKKELP